jgi:hypothetical protein
MTDDVAIATTARHAPTPHSLVIGCLAAHRPPAPYDITPSELSATVSLGLYRGHKSYNTSRVLCVKCFLQVVERCYYDRTLDGGKPCRRENPCKPSPTRDPSVGRHSGPFKFAHRVARDSR